MEHASFIIGSWAITVVAVGAYVVWTVRRGRALARRATKEEMPWT